MDLQSNLIESSKLRNGKRKGWKATLAALGVHGLIIALVVVMGATATHKVAAENKIQAFVAHAAAPPPPPPPPPPPAGSSTPKPTPVVKPVVIPQTSFVQPREIPKEVPKVEPVATTETAPPSTSEQPAGEPGGVAGGVPGGVAGGVQGGVVGGTVGGVLGGQIGGQLGGVPGGQVGGTGTETAAPEKPEGPLRVGGDVKAPLVQHRVEPVYPDMARKTRVAGIVIVEAIINKDGSVEQVKVIKGLPMGMSESAVEAVKQWKFKPGTLNGQPVDVIFNLTVNFKLD
jgi:periplasmic protein TonB